MKEILLDTHVWFWYLTGSRRLGARLRKVVDSRTDALWLSSISVWELGMLAAKGRVHIPGDFRSWRARAMERMPVRIAPVDAEIALTGLYVDLAHGDPADRFIAATAVVHGLALATQDRRLTGLGWLPTA